MGGSIVQGGPGTKSFGDITGIGTLAATPVRGCHRGGPSPQRGMPMRRLWLSASTAFVLALVTGPALAGHTLTVWPGAMHGWAIRLTDDGTPPVTATAGRFVLRIWPR